MEDVNLMKEDFLRDLSELENDTKTLLNRIKLARKDIKKACNIEDLEEIDDKYGSFDENLKFIRIF